MHHSVACFSSIPVSGSPHRRRRRRPPHCHSSRPVASCPPTRPMRPFLRARSSSKPDPHALELSQSLAISDRVLGDRNRLQTRRHELSDRASVPACLPRRRVHCRDLVMERNERRNGTKCRDQQIQTGQEPFPSLPINSRSLPVPYIHSPAQYLPVQSRQTLSSYFVPSVHPRRTVRPRQAGTQGNIWPFLPYDCGFTWPFDRTQVIEQNAVLWDKRSKGISPRPGTATGTGPMTLLYDVHARAL
ncbi:hypothetical protein MPTK2_1g21540 [Marchantia polymorpha subsp. ruderalis]